jgi:predicted exporter
VTLWAGFLVLTASLAARTPVVTQLADLIPHTDETALLLDEVQWTRAARLILVGLDGDSAAARAAVSARLTDALTATGLFIRVSNGGRAAGSADALAPLFRHRYLLSPSATPEAFTAVRLRAALEQRLIELRSPVTPFEKAWLPADPTLETLTLARRLLVGVGEPALRDGVWVSPDGRRALVLAETQASGFDSQAQAPVVAAIERAFADASAGTKVTLTMSGPGVLAASSERLIKEDAARLGALATAAILGMLMVVYGSLRVILLSTLPLGLGFIAAIAATGLVFGSIHGVTLGFGATLIGVGGDYPIHLFSHLHPGETVGASLRRIWPTLRLSVAVAAIGYLAMIATGFTGLAQLGVFSIVGLLTAALVTRSLLPQLLPDRWVPPRQRGIGRWMDRLTRPHAAPGRVIAAAAAGAALLLVLVVVRPPPWEEDLAALNPLPADVLARDRQLRADLGAPEPGHVLFIRAGTTEAALQLSEQVADALRPLVKAGVLRGFQAPSDLLASQRTQLARQRALPVRDLLQAALAEATAGLPFRPGLFQPFLDDVEQARKMPAVSIDAFANTPAAAAISALLWERSGGWTALVLLTGVADVPALARAIAPLAKDGVHFVDFRAESNAMMRQFRHSALGATAAGALLLAATIAFGVRSWRRALLVLLPMALAVLLDLCALSLAGARLSLFHLVSLLLVVGISIDYALFASEPEPDNAQRRRTLHALLVCSSSTVAGFLVLCFSSLPVLNAIGQTVTIGVIAAFACAGGIARPLVPPHAATGHAHRS